MAESRARQTHRTSAQMATLNYEISLASLALSERETENKAEKEPTSVLSSIFGSDYPALVHKCSTFPELSAEVKRTTGLWYIQSLYQCFDQYLKHLLLEVFQNDSRKLLGIIDSSITMSSNDILEIGSYDNMCEKLVFDTFRKMENERSTIKLIESVQKKLTIKVAKPVESNALTVLELRHLIVHNRGKIDKKYEKSYPEKKLVDGMDIPTDREFLSHVLTNIENLIVAFDTALIEKGIVKVI